MYLASVQKEIRMWVSFQKLVIPQSWNRIFLVFASHFPASPQLGGIMNEAAPVKAGHAMMENRSNSSWQGGGEDQKRIWQIWNPTDFVFDSRDCKIRWIEGHDQRIAGMAELGGGMNGNRAISRVPLNSKLRLHNLQYVQNVHLIQVLPHPTEIHWCSHKEFRALRQLWRGGVENVTKAPSWRHKQNVSKDATVEHSQIEIPEEEITKGTERALKCCLVPEMLNYLPLICKIWSVWSVSGWNPLPGMYASPLGSKQPLIAVNVNLGLKRLKRKCTRQVPHTYILYIQTRLRDIEVPLL